MSRRRFGRPSPQPPRCSGARALGRPPMRRSGPGARCRSAQLPPLSISLLNVGRSHGSPSPRGLPGFRRCSVRCLSARMFHVKHCHPTLTHGGIMHSCQACRIQVQKTYLVTVRPFAGSIPQTANTVRLCERCLDSVTCKNAFERGRTQFVRERTAKQALDNHACRWNGSR